MLTKAVDVVQHGRWTWPQTLYRHVWTCPVCGCKWVLYCFSRTPEPPRCHCGVG
jgi:hypothetical protein